jgi:hypothetical protein
MKEYRTDEQFTEIIDSIINGQFTQAANEAVEYGFWAADLDRKLEDYRTTYGYDHKYMYDLAVRLIYVAEDAAELRGGDK